MFIMLELWIRIRAPRFFDPPDPGPGGLPVLKSNHGLNIEWYAQGARVWIQDKEVVWKGAVLEKVSVWLRLTRLHTVGTL